MNIDTNIATAALSADSQEFYEHASYYPFQMDSELKCILGKPNFWCGRYVAVFRDYWKATGASAQEVRERAEDEQAFLLHHLIQLYLLHGAKWAEAFERELHTMIEAVKRTKNSND